LWLNTILSIALYYQQKEIMDHELWNLIWKTVSESGSIEKAVFGLLLIFSLISWCIVLMKMLDFRTASKNNEAFSALFASADNFGSVMTNSHNIGPSPLLESFKAAMRSLETRRSTVPTLSGNQNGAMFDPRSIALRPASTPEDLIVLEMQNAAMADFERLRRGLPFLATIGSTAPFIGLFGTVWGIINTFRALSDATTVSLNQVAPGISSALIATAAGLVVAIPAVMAYNYFLTRLNPMQDVCDNFIQRMRVVIKASLVLEQPNAVAPVLADPIEHADVAPRAF
jgi:biopolymer transport protein TolQ